jgi:hypothetical protein
MDDNNEGLTPQHGGSDGIEFDDLCATFFDGQFSATEKIDSKTGEVSAEARFKTTNEALEDLFGGPQFAQRNDDHDYRDRANKDGKNEKPGEIEFHDGEITLEDLFGPDQHSDHRPQDTVWWDRENPEEDYDWDEGRKIKHGTDPEDEHDPAIKSERIERIQGSSLDPGGRAIYYTKGVRSDIGRAGRNRTRRLDGGWQRRKKKDKGVRTRDDLEKYNDQVRYVKQKLMKAGEPIPTTEAEWSEAVARHVSQQAEKRLKAAIVNLICDRQGCVRKTGYNRLTRMIRNAEQQGRWHEALLRAFINRAARLSHENRETDGEKRERRTQRTPERAAEPTPEERRENLRADPRMSRPDYKHVPPRHC